MVFTEVPKPAKVPRMPAVVEIVLPSGHLVRVPAGADSDTLRRVLQALTTATVKAVANAATDVGKSAGKAGKDLGKSLGSSVSNLSKGLGGLFKKSTN